MVGAVYIRRNKMITFEEVKEANKVWFSEGNMRFFGDTGYWLAYNPDGNPCLIRETAMWSDMFGQEKKFVYRINRIDPETLKIQDLYDEIFKTRKEAVEFIETLP